MSSLEAVYQQKKEELKAEGLSKHKVRLAADPFIGVSDIEDALSRHCQQKSLLTFTRCCVLQPHWFTSLGKHHLILSGC